MLSWYENESKILNRVDGNQSQPHIYTVARIRLRHTDAHGRNVGVKEQKSFYTVPHAHLLSGSGDKLLSLGDSYEGVPIAGQRNFWQVETSS